MTYLLLAYGIKMADGHQENSQNLNIPEATENGSNDAEEADEVCYINCVSHSTYTHFCSCDIELSTTKDKLRSV